MREVAKTDSDSNTICMLNGNSRSLEIWSTMTFSNVLRIDKKRDYNITSFDKVGKFIAYSDCKDTQVFTFD